MSGWPRSAVSWERRKVYSSTLWRRCQWPVTGSTPKSAYRLRSVAAPAATTTRAMVLVGGPGQQRSSSARPMPRP